MIRSADLSESAQLTSLEIKGSQLTWIFVIVLYVLPMFTLNFKEIFNTLDAELPLLTLLVLNAWYPYSVATACSLLKIIQRSRWSRQLIGRQRVFIILSFIIIVVGIALYVIGMYLPMIAIVNELNQN